MAPKLVLDEKDVKILQILIRDARARLKDIAKECGISSVSALNRIKRLKKIEIITGSTLFTDLSEFGLPIVATIGINIDGNRKDEVINAISEQTNLVEPSASIGKYDLSTLVFAESINELNKIAQLVKKNFGAREVALNIWSGRPQMIFENINLRSTEEKAYG